MTVCCLRTGERYGPEYSERLHAGIARYTTKPFEFVTKTKSKYPGWWGKVGWLNPTERIIVLDLDLVITGNVDFLFDYDGPFCIWKDPMKPVISWYDCKPCYNSSVMSIAPGFGAEIRKKFEVEPFRVMNEFWGDQEFISSMLPEGVDTWNEIAPGKVKSFKADGLNDGPGDAAICVFHGQPKMADFPPEHWVSRAWQ